MHILLINHYAGPERYCPPYRTNYLAREWVNLGHHVTIVGASYSHLFFKTPSYQGIVKIEESEGVDYLIIKTPKFSGNGIMRVVNMLMFVLLISLKAFWISSRVKPDIVIASSVYPLDFIPSYLISMISHSRLFREVRDLWPLTLIELGNMSKRNPFVVFLGIAERISYKCSDQIVTTLSHSLSYMKTKGLDEKKWVYIPQGFEPSSHSIGSIVFLNQQLEKINDFKAKGYFSIGYTGGHGIANALDVFIEAAFLLKNKKVIFVLVGQGPGKIHLMNTAKERNLSNVLFFDPIPKNSVSILLSQFDATYLGWKKNPMYQYGISPNKLMDYMNSAKPIIHSVNAPNDLVSITQCGISVQPEDPVAIANAIESLMRMSPVEREKMGKRGKEYLLKYHDYKIIAKNYINVIEKQ